jgi:hypothetical protein
MCIKRNRAGQGSCASRARAWRDQSSTAVRGQFLLPVTHNDMCTMMSAVPVTHAARWSRMSTLQPADVAEVTGPGTAISGRVRSLACRAVARVPLRSAASMMTVPRASAAFFRVSGAVARCCGYLRRACFTTVPSTCVPQLKMLSSPRKRGLSCGDA